MTRKQAEMPALEAGAPVLTLDQIAAADDVAHEDVSTPEWGGVTRVAALTGKQRMDLIAWKTRADKEHGEAVAEQLAMYQLVAASLVDGDGNRVPDVAAAAAVLEGKANAPLLRVFGACSRLSGLGDDELDKRVDELGKTGPSADSSTD
jgi:hypothetical protein